MDKVFKSDSVGYGRLIIFKNHVDKDVFVVMTLTEVNNQSKWVILSKDEIEKLYEFVKGE